METGERTKEEKALLGLKITNFIMILVTAAMIGLAVYYLMKVGLPFGMTAKPETNPMIIKIGLIAIAALALIQTVLGFLGVNNRKMCKACALVGFILVAVYALLYYLAIGMEGTEWFAFAGLIACPLINANFADGLARLAGKSS